MRIDVEVFGDSQVDRELLKYQDRADDMTPALQFLADDFYEMEQRQFASQGGFASAGWAPLSPTYAAQKAAAFPGKGILEATGDLLESLTRPGVRAIRDISPDELHVATRVPYARFHQTGTRKMPRRRVVEFRAQDRVRWVKVLQSYLETGHPGTNLTGVLGGF